MPYRDRERTKEANRAWHRKRPDGRCEATTAAGKRCRFQGVYDGLTAQIVCEIHARVLTR